MFVCFSTATHSYQDLLARYVLGHAMRMVPLCRRYYPSAMCTLGSYYLWNVLPRLRLDILRLVIIHSYIKLNLIDFHKLYSYSVTTSSQLLDTSTKTDLPRPRLAHHSVTYPYPRKGEVATRHHNTVYRLDSKNFFSLSAFIFLLD